MNAFPASEIAAWIAIVSMLGGSLVWLLHKHFNGIFLSKRAYYAQRDDDARAAAVAQTKAEAEAKEYRDKVLAQIQEMNTNLSGFMEKIAEWKSDFQSRVKVLEDRAERAPRARRSTGGR